MNSMFGISWKTNILKSDLLLGMTDLHAHLLPGVDDGIQTWDEAQRAVDWLYALGTRRMYLTPHVMEELGNTAASLRERFDEWQARISGPMHFRLAAEYMLDNGFARQRKEGLLTLDERHLLIETSYMAPPMDLEGILYDLQTDGYELILAHPERYMYMDDEQYDRLRDCGIQFQLNLMSLAGTYGRLPQMKATRLLDAGAYCYVGSDFHRQEAYASSLQRLYFNKRRHDALVRLFIDTQRLWTGDGRYTLYNERINAD